MLDEHHIVNSGNGPSSEMLTFQIHKSAKTSLGLRQFTKYCLYVLHNYMVLSSVMLLKYLFQLSSKRARVGSSWTHPEKSAVHGAANSSSCSRAWVTWSALVTYGASRTWHTPTAVVGEITMFLFIIRFLSGNFAI